MAKVALVTGAYGFIGRHVARQFASEGWRVIGLGHGSWSHEEWQKWGIAEWHQADVTLESLIIYGGRPDVIVHCAGSGSVGFSIVKPAVDFDLTVRTTSNVLEFIRMHSPTSRLVYLSSGAVYGQVNAIPIVEETPLKPVSPYGLHKQMAEALCQLYSFQFGVSSVIARLFSIYGPELRKQLLWDACRKFEQGDCCFFGTGKEIRDWVHVEDAAKLLFTAERNATSLCPIVNVGSGQGLSVNELLQFICNQLGLDIKPTFSSKPKKGDPDKYVADIAKASDWGWKPKIDWRHGIAEYMQWYKRCH